MVWARQNMHFDYFAKTDDDAFVHVPRMLQLLGGVPVYIYICGGVHVRACHPSV